MNNAGKAAKLLHHSLVSSGYKCTLDEEAGRVTIGFGGDAFNFDRLIIKIKLNEDLTGTLSASGILDIPDDKRGAVLEECNTANDLLHGTEFFIGGQSSLCCSLEVLYAPLLVEEAYRDALRLLLKAVDISFPSFAKAIETHAPSKDERDADDSSSVPTESLSFIAVDEDGRHIHCQALFLFEHDGRNIIVYTDESEDDEGNTRVYASQYNPKDLVESSEGDLCALPMAPITREDDWKAVEAILERLQDQEDGYKE